MSTYRVDWIERHTAYVDFDKLAAEFAAEWAMAQKDGETEHGFLVETLYEMGEDFFHCAAGVSDIVEDNEADVTQVLRKPAWAAK